MADNVIVRVPEQQFIRGEDGYSPEVTIENIDHGHSVTITDREHQEEGQTFNVLDGDSAYEQAVAGGYTGTEAQFNEELASFKELSDEMKEVAPFYAEYGVTTKAEIEAAINNKRQIYLNRGGGLGGVVAPYTGTFLYADIWGEGTGYRFARTNGNWQYVYELKSEWTYSIYDLTAPAQRAETAAAQALTRMNSADASAQAAAGSAGDASAAATTATTKAGEASDSATAADGSAKDAEAYAVGKRGGTDVGSTDPAYHNNAKYYAQQAALIVDDVEQVMTSTAVGPASIVTFDASVADMPLKGLTVNIEPVQSGSGDPSPENVRSITGWTGCNIYRSGEDMSNPTAYAITFPTSAGTVYGGTLDVVNGVLKVTHAITTVSAKTWRYESNYTRFNAGFANIVIGKYGTRKVPFMCSAFQPIDDGRSLTNVPNNSIYGAGTSATVFIKTDTVSTVEDFISTYGNVQILYELAEPLVYDIADIHDVLTLLGTNNIWADAGDVTVTYGAYLEAVKNYANQAADSAAAAEDAQEAAEAVLESIPSDYTELSEDVSDLKSAVDNNAELSFLGGGISCGWEQGSYLFASGVPSPNSARIRTKSYIDKSIKFITADSAHAEFGVLAYNDEGVFQGTWNGSSLGTAIKWHTSVNLNDIYALGDYNIKLSVRDKVNTSADIGTEYADYLTCSTNLGHEVNSISNSTTALSDDFDSMLTAPVITEKQWTLNYLINLQDGTNLSQTFSNGARSSYFQITEDFWLVCRKPEEYVFSVYGYSRDSASGGVKSLSFGEYSNTPVFVKHGDGVSWYRVSVKKLTGDITSDDTETLTKLFEHKYTYSKLLFPVETQIINYSNQAYFAMRLGVDPADGRNLNDSLTARSAYIPISSTPFILHNPSSEYMTMVWTYSDVGQGYGIYSITGNEYRKGDIYIDRKDAYMRIAVRRVDGAELTTGTGTTTDEYKISHLYTMLTQEKYDNPELFTSLAIFPKIGVVGDSFASGSLHHPGGEWTGNYNLSWPQIMARLIGSTAFNFSQGGLSSRTWLTNADYGLPKLLSTEKQNLYIVALGINDSSEINRGDMVLGSIADCKEDYTQNADSFYGYYGKVIGNIKTYAPDSKIVCLSVARFNQRVMDTHIEAVANFYGVPYIDLTSDNFFRSAFYYQSMNDGHPLAYGYGGMATAIKRLVEKCIVDNVDYFKTYYGLPLDGT